MFQSCSSFLLAEKSNRKFPGRLKTCLEYSVVEMLNESKGGVGGRSEAIRVHSVTAYKARQGKARQGGKWTEKTEKRLILGTSTVGPQAR
ncbi:hypothetical protein IF2G_08394 [Cordyceps javanica]|nr:hypothetical protein IF2G_08394 [Cordyceps javanica]